MLAQPARPALIVRLAATAIGLIFAFPPALHVACRVELDAVRLALQRIDVFLALQAENGVAKAEVVPVGLAAARRVEPGAAVQQGEDWKKPHTRPTSPRATYSGTGLSPSWPR